MRPLNINCRPVSLTCILCKVLKCMKNLGQPRFWIKPKSMISGRKTSRSFLWERAQNCALILFILCAFHPEPGEVPALIYSDDSDFSLWKLIPTTFPVGPYPIQTNLWTTCIANVLAVLSRCKTLLSLVYILVCIVYKMCSGYMKLEIYIYYDDAIFIVRN